MAITQDELVQITGAVLSSLSTNSRTIDQLTPTDTLSDGDSFEVSGGKKIAYELLKQLISEGLAQGDLSNVEVGDLLDKIKNYFADKDLSNVSDKDLVGKVESYFAAKDLSNVSVEAFTDKNVYPKASFNYSTDGDHTVIVEDDAATFASLLQHLTGTSADLLYASAMAADSPVSLALVTDDPIDYSLSFFGNDGYLHVLRVNGLGAISQQYAYRIDDLATKSFLTSGGYRPMRVIDLGSYRDGVFSLDGTPYWGDMQTTLYSYLDGGCGVLLQAHNQYNEPQVFVPTRIYRSGGTLYVIEFMVSATQLCEIRIDEDADIESGESLFSQQFTAIGSGGSGGSGTVTTEAFSDINDYNEVK